MLDAMIAPPMLSTVKFVLVVLAVQVMLLYAVYHTGADPAARRRRVLLTAAAFLLVMAGFAALAASGALTADPRRALALFAATNLAVLVLAFSRAGAAMAAAVAPVYWVIFGGFRVPLEIILHAWGEAGSIPVQMTWDGQNFDVIAGLAALVLGAFWLLRPGARWAGLTAHVVGLVLLANVGRIAILSLPTSFRAFAGEPLVLPLHAPYVWIIPFGVAAALFAHVVGLRAMFGHGHSQAGSSASLKR